MESPTGSGKTTQLPRLLYDAGYAEHGRIGVTQPRRIAAVSVTDFVRAQLAADGKDDAIAAYKMRFEDTTGERTRIKIMTDGVLLQELKHDRLLSEYAVLRVDEAHERSLTIDFVLGLLKVVLAARPGFKVIVSSATINAEVFAEYFDGCPDRPHRHAGASGAHRLSPVPAQRRPGPAPDRHRTDRAGDSPRPKAGRGC